MPYYRLITFGCKVNQHDSAGLAQELARLGWETASASVCPDVVVVNTCTVTARADQEARQVIRRHAREHPGVPVWVTGCYAQRAPEELAALPGVRAVIGNREKIEMVRVLAGGGQDEQPLCRVGNYSPLEPFRTLHPLSFPGHTRAALKVQEGCSHACSYCIVPKVRGPGRSLPVGEVEAAFEDLAARGYQEVVLTGIDLGQYGLDLAPAADLAGLLRRLAAHSWPFRLRLSSLEPQGVNAGLLDALGALPGLCPHFHLPLQSGSAAVLDAMGRPYRPEEFRDLAQELARRFPGAAIGLDVIVGFPGESAADFAATLALVQALPAAYLHVFPFSPRPGTPAALLPALPPVEVRRRAQLLRELGRRKRAAFYQDHLGKVADVLVEGPAPENGWLKGLSANYLRVLLPGPPSWRNRLLPVKFVERQDAALIGRALE